MPKMPDTAHRNQHIRCFSVAMSRGSGSIAIIYPDVALEDHVSHVWLKEHKYHLPAGTIVRFPDGCTLTIDAEAQALPGLD